jgi:predicted DNA-binding protein with PD1-like motif
MVVVKEILSMGGDVQKQDTQTFAFHISIYLLRAWVDKDLLDGHLVY